MKREDIIKAIEQLKEHNVKFCNRVSNYNDLYLTERLKLSSLLSELGGRSKFVCSLGTLNDLNPDVLTNYRDLDLTIEQFNKIRDNLSVAHEMMKIFCEQLNELKVDLEEGIENEV